MHRLRCGFRPDFVFAVCFYLFVQVVPTVVRFRDGVVVGQVIFAIGVLRDTLLDEMIVM